MNDVTELDRAAAAAQPAPVPPMPAADVGRPVKLQVNRLAGIWATVIVFDAGNTVAEGYVRMAVEMLSAVDPTARFRIVASGLVQGGGELLTYSAGAGWQTS